MKTATAVLATIPATARPKRHEAGAAKQLLSMLIQYSSSMDVSHLAYGIRYADETCRIGGTLSMALRKATPWQAAQLIVAMAADGVEVIAQVPAWLNQNGLAALARV
jgi:hypothetical protein